MTRPALRRGLVLALLGATALAAPRDVELGAIGDGGLAVGRARVHLGWGAALAQSAGDVTLEEVSLGGGAMTLRAPRVEVRGTALSRDALRAILDPASSDPWAARLARLSAREIAIPELRVEQSIGARRQLAVYKDVVARDVAAGKVGRLEANGAEIRAEGGPKPLGGTYGHIQAAEVDLAGVAQLYGERPEAPGPMRRLYGPFTLDDLAFTDQHGVEMRVARTEGAGLEARAVRDSWETVAGRLAAMRPDGGTPEQRSRLFGDLAEVFDATRIGAVTLSGLTVRDPSARQPVDVRVTRIAYAGADRPAELRFEGIEVAAAEGRMKLASAVSSGFSFAPTLAAMKQLADKKPEAPGGKPAPLDPAELRELMPSFGTLQLGGLSFEGKAPEPEGGPISFGLRAAEIRTERPLNGVPTGSRLSVDGLTVAIPPDTKQEGLKDLAAMGYRDLDLSWLLDLAWSEATGELAVREISLTGRDMGSARIRGTVAGLGKDVFDPDTAVAAAAVMGAAAKSLDVTVQNGGLYERLVAQQAKAQGRTPEELRRDYAMLAAAGIPAMLGGAPAAKAIGQAVARFAAKPGRLSISARAKDAAGLGIADLTSANGPAGILDLVEVTATVE